MSHLVDPTTKDIIDRLSRASISRCEHDLEQEDPGQRDAKYGAILTPPPLLTNTPSESIPALLHDEPFTPQPVVVEVADCRWFGLVLHSVVIGVISTALPLTVFPFLTNYLNMEGTQTLSARTILAMPWVLKPFFMIFTDCVPLMCGGYHRRPYMILGWFVCAAALISIYFVEQPKPYFVDRSLVGTPLIKLSGEQISQSINLEAPKHGGLYVMFMSVATTGYILADVAADALITEIARSDFNVVGHSQDEVFAPTLTKYRYMAVLATFVLMGFGMSGENYGGTFGFTLEYTQMMLILGIFATLPIPLAWATIAETRRMRHSFRRYLKKIWNLFLNRAINKVILFRFIGGIFGGISAAAVNPVAFYWAQVQPMNDTVASFVAVSAVFGALSYADTRGWQINYRLLIIGANLVLLFLDCGATMFTIWGVVRSMWFWIGLPVMEAIPSGLDYVIFTVVLGEIVDPGDEQITTSLVTAVSFLAGPVGLMLSKYIDAQFAVTNQDVMVDSTDIRVHVTLVFVIAYICQIISMGWLLVLPQHASEAREWKKLSGNSTSHAVGLITLLVLLCVWTVVVHIMSLNTSTACMAVAAGKGC